MSDLTKAPVQIILDMINEANAGASLTSADVSFGLPTDISGSNPQRNTELAVTAVNGGAYGGSANIRYNRIAMADILTAGGGVGLTNSFLRGTHTLISQVIADFNSRFNTNMVAGEDYADGPLPTFEEIPGEQHTFTVTALAGSLIYIGSMQLIVRMDTVDLGSVITVEDLDGLTYETPIV